MDTDIKKLEKSYCKEMMKFFKHKSVRWNFSFPKSCFKNINTIPSFRMTIRVKGAMRNFAFMGKEYNDFLNDNNIKIFFKKFWKIKTYKNSGVRSFTDIYSLDSMIRFNAKINQNMTYSKLMYNNWKQFKELKDNLSKTLKFCAYIDLAHFYDQIYSHFLYGIQVQKIEDFQEYEQKFNDDDFLKKKTKQYINHFFKAYEYHLNIKKQSPGINIGNGVSDFVAELFCKMVDYFWIHKRKISKSICILRFRDDLFIFGNEKKDVDILYNEYNNILPKIKLCINENKSYNAREVISEVDSAFEYREKLLQKNFNYLKNANSFVKKYPESNYIYFLLQKSYLHSKITKKDFRYFKTIYEYSNTNVLPWILAIIDHNGNKKIFDMYKKFINNIEFSKLSDSDKIWIWCFEKKNKINSEKYYKCESLVKDLKLYNNWCEQNIDLYLDADSWQYSEI